MRSALQRGRRMIAMKIATQKPAAPLTPAIPSPYPRSSAFIRGYSPRTPLTPTPTREKLAESTPKNTITSPAPPLLFIGGRESSPAAHFFPSQNPLSPSFRDSTWRAEPGSKNVSREVLRIDISSRDCDIVGLSNGRLRETSQNSCAEAHRTRRAAIRRKEIRLRAASARPLCARTVESQKYGYRQPA